MLPQALDKIGGTRFVLFILLAVLGAYLVRVGSLDGSMYWGFLTANYGAYVSGKVIDNKNQLNAQSLNPPTDAI